MPLITLDAVSLAFGLDPLLNHIDFQIDSGERIGLIGRNGGGKSTLLRLVLGILAPDEGKIWRQPSLRMGYVPQEPELDPESSIFDAVAQGLTECGLPVASYQVERQLSQMGLEPEGRVGQLSGGWKKRVALARALVSEPDLLILDEPTNHLDVAAIERLEGALRNFPGAVLFITHDRHFLDQVVTRVVELDRGKLSTLGPPLPTTCAARPNNWPRKPSNSVVSTSCSARRKYGFARGSRHAAPAMRDGYDASRNCVANVPCAGIKWGRSVWPWIPVIDPGN